MYELWMYYLGTVAMNLAFMFTLLWNGKKKCRSLRKKIILNKTVLSHCEF
jgi:hypothetical protein